MLSWRWCNGQWQHLAVNWHTMVHTHVLTKGEVGRTQANDIGNVGVVVVFHSRLQRNDPRGRRQALRWRVRLDQVKPEQSYSIVREVTS